MSKINENFENGKFAVSDLSKKDAESIAMSINLLFGNAKMFSPTHPSTEQSAKILCEKISEASGKSPLISFIKSGKSFYVEKWFVDNKISLSRFTSDFGKLYIESISFAKNVSVKNVMDFVQIFIFALENNLKADEIQEILTKNADNGIALNYITFQKVAKGDKVISADEIVVKNVNELGISDKFMVNQTAEILFDNISDLEPPHEHETETPKNAISHLEKLFNIKSTIENNFSEESGKNLSLINNELIAINEQITQQRTNEIDYDLLFNSLVDISKITKSAEFLFNDKKDDEKEKIISQIDQMTIDAVLKIIKKEIKSNNFSIKKFVLLVIRLDLKKDDLQRMLPQIKNTMIDNGLTISDYLNFVMELGNKLNEDKAIGKIFDKAEDLGVKSSEIVEAFSLNPQESIKLILQSVEIQKQHAANINLSDYLAKMIDDISQDTAMQKIKSKKIGGDVHSVISSVISSVNDGILAKFKESGLDLNTTNEIQKGLMEKFPQTLENLKNEWLVNTLGNAENLSQDAIVKVLTQVAYKNEDTDSYEKTLSYFSEKFNLSPSEITQILENVRNQKELSEQKKNLPLLPPKETIHFIKRYIEEYKRHKHPFSIIMISDKDKNKADMSLNVAEKIAFLLSETFRLLDISGFVRIRNKEIAVIILPMTASSGVNKVWEKIDAVIDTQDHILTSVSYELPAKDESYDIVMKKLLRGHL